MRARLRPWTLAAAGLALGLGLGAPAPLAAAARLEIAGSPLPPRSGEALLAPALRSPGDRAALVEALGALVARLQEQGWLDARASATWDSAATPVLRVEVRPGARSRLASLALDTPGAADSAAFAAALGLAPGGWAAPGALAAAVERAVGSLSDHGHPYATLGVSGWVADSSGVHVRLAGARGPAVIVDRVRFEGLGVTREGLARRLVGRLDGAPYDRGSAEAGRDRLAQSGLFRRAEYAGLEGAADWSRGTLVYRVEEPRYNRFEGAVGVQGDAGTVGLARLGLGNLLGTGRTLALEWQSRGRGLTDFAARYAEPLLFGTPLRLELAVAQQVQDTIFVRSRWGARGQLALSPQERLEAGYEQERVVQDRVLVQRADLQNTVFALERATLDSPLIPRRGTRARVAAAQVFKSEHLRPTGRRSARASSVEGRFEWHRPAGSRAGLALELLGAGRFSTERVLPLFERWPLGGAATLRGFDEEAFRVDRYALSRAEWRLFLGSRGEHVALFWDHAWMQTRLALPEGGDRLQSLRRDGIGFGIRLEAAGGRVGVDYGLEPGRPPLEGKIHLQLVSTF
jgi:outer membrane protein assembly factor BamA